ncbi:hypothetical protein HID58_077891 [Brassica napus]|uniref:Leucine-rich repeat-containing N-terminal plant-type domain-containing protein n=1 Tax=Brassica napus TaxID=3708 RepID=A0ABQ7YSP6_BRANA|nr:hypothetical protein HID58_077891 [Brassica napus]
MVRFALLKFRVRMNSDPHGTLSNWNVSGSDLCSWSRVTCVEGILISGCSLEGMLAPELRQLRAISLERFQRSMGVPENLSLGFQDLRDNDLSGTISPELSNVLSPKHL